MEKQNPRLLDQVRDKIRMMHYSIRTEETYIYWIKYFIFFNNKRHPLEMGEKEISRFLTYLAVKKNVSASTQNQAFSAILFYTGKYYKENLVGLRMYQGLKSQIDYRLSLQNKKQRPFSPGWKV